MPGVAYEADKVAPRGYIRFPRWPSCARFRSTAPQNASVSLSRGSRLSTKDKAVGSPILECLIEGYQLASVTGHEGDQIGIGPHLGRRGRRF